jgi:hypothetical protein
MLSGSRGWICRLTVFTVPIKQKIRELERLLAGAGEHGGQHRARLAQQLQGMRMATAAGPLSGFQQSGSSDSKRSAIAASEGSSDIALPMFAARIRIYPLDEIWSRSQGEESAEVSLSERDEILGDQPGTPTASASTAGNGTGSGGGGASKGSPVHGGVDGHREYWGGWVQLQQANAQLQRCEEGYFDGFSPQPLLQLQDFHRGDSTGRVARTMSDELQRGGGMGDSGVHGERLRGAMRLGSGQRGKAGPTGNSSASGGTVIVQCRRDEHGNAGYRVTLNQLEVCEISRDSVGYANGLRDNQRVTHVDGYPVSNWEEYRDRAHGRDSFSLTVVLPYAQAHHFDGIDGNSFGMEYCRVEVDDIDDDMTAAPAAPAAVLPLAQHSAANTPHAAMTAADDVAIAAEESEHGHFWCVHRDCTDEVHPFHSQAALALHMQETHGVQKLQYGKNAELAAEAAQEPGRSWFGVRCGSPAIPPSMGRTVSSSSSGGGRSRKRRDY